LTAQRLSELHPGSSNYSAKGIPLHPHGCTVFPGGVGDSHYTHLDFGKSTISKADLSKMVKSGYFSENEKKLLRFGGEETTPKPEKNEIVIFKSFLKVGLRFLLNRMISDVLQRFGIYFHQLTPNAIVRLSVYIWALRSGEARRWSHLPTTSVEFMSCITKLRPEKMDCMKILVAIILLIGKPRSFP
jgi:hypothetical protein